MEIKNELWPCNSIAGFQYLRDILVTMYQQTLSFKKYWVISGLKSVEYNTRWHCINTYKGLHFFCFKGPIKYENLIEVCGISSLIFVLWSL